MTLAAFCLAYAGFSALCLGMDRHYEDVFDRELPRRHRLSLRLFGWIALALSRGPRRRSGAGATARSNGSASSASPACC